MCPRLVGLGLPGSRIGRAAQNVDDVLFRQEDPMPLAGELIKDADRVDTSTRGVG